MSTRPQSEALPDYLGQNGHALQAAVVLVIGVTPHVNEKILMLPALICRCQPLDGKDSYNFHYDPLHCPLPDAPSMSIYCLYGTGKPTERSYQYLRLKGPKVIYLCPSVLPRQLTADLSLSMATHVDLVSLFVLSAMRRLWGGAGEGGAEEAAEGGGRRERVAHQRGPQRRRVDAWGAARRRRRHGPARQPRPDVPHVRLPPPGYIRLGAVETQR